MSPFRFPMPRAAAFRPSLTLRPIEERDLSFLERLYASTREEELSIVPWSQEEKRQFLHMQFTAQHKFYGEQFPDAIFTVVESEDLPAGRLYIDFREDEIRIVDVALLPEYRSRGIGSALLGDLLEEAQRNAVSVRIHVEHNNPAMRLYQRLGFRELDTNGIYRLMEWRSASTLEGS